MMTKIIIYPKMWLDKLKVFDFLAPLAFRLYLVPILWMAGTNKLFNFESTVSWFGNPDWGLGLPFPTLMALMAIGSEVIGAICLFFGVLVRWVAIPLMITMLVAIFSVHIDNGWFAIAPEQSDAATRLSGFLGWLEGQYPQRHEFITALAKPVALNNGIEFAVTYFIMLLSLFFTGAGKYLSVDYWVVRHYSKKLHLPEKIDQ